MPAGPAMAPSALAAFVVVVAVDHEVGGAFQVVPQRGLVHRSEVGFAHRYPHMRQPAVAAPERPSVRHLSGHHPGRVLAHTTDGMGHADGGPAHLESTTQSTARWISALQVVARLEG